MTILSKYALHYAPVKYFLSSYRALSDARSGIRHLQERLDEATFLVSEWKVIWIGSCTLLRTAIDLFQVDAKSCLSPEIRKEMVAEWKAINSNRDDNRIFWDFLKKERDNIIHQYEWRAYEAWIKADGTFVTSRLSLLSLANEGDAKPSIRMRSGPFAGHDSLDLLKEGASWVEERMFSAVRRAGFNPEEYRNLVDFRARPRGLSSLISGDENPADTGSGGPTGGTAT